MEVRETHVRRMEEEGESVHLLEYHNIDPFAAVEENSWNRQDTISCRSRRAYRAAVEVCKDRKGCPSILGKPGRA